MLARVIWSMNKSSNLAFLAASRHLRMQTFCHCLFIGW